jgi:hypothetical protein
VTKPFPKKWFLLVTSVFLVGVARAEDKIDESLKRATKYLLETQDPKTGAIHNKMRNENAMTSLSILALASQGIQPTDPTPEGQSMRKALDYVLRPEGQDEDGYFGASDGSRMYGHGITTLMLSEMLGMGVDAKQDALLRVKCRKAVSLILRAQKEPKTDQNRGGWRYSPDDKQSDMSVTVWQVMALRAAKNAGIDVPKDAIDDAVAYIKRLYEPENGKGGRGIAGGFGYQSKGRETSTTAEGLLALQVCGEYQSEEVGGASAKLLRDGIRQGDKWFFYTAYYYAQGMYQMGGKFADTGIKLVPELVLPLQSREGWWEGAGAEERQGGKVYATTLAMLSLAVKNHYLPIYQR